MKRARNNPFALWSQLAFKTGEMMLASAQVIDHRTKRMAKASIPPSSRDQREFTRMGAEKVAAAAESARNMAADMITFNQQIAQMATRQILSGKAMPSVLQVKRLAKTAGQMADKGLTPFHRRATANAKRLTKKT